MAIYFIQVLLIALLGYGFKPNESCKGRRNFILCTFILLTIISGFRAYSVGADTGVYVNIYNSIEYIQIDNQRFEPGFIIYLKILHWFSNDPGFLLIISSIICIGTTCLFVNKLSLNPTLSMLLYILMGGYFSQMNIMRQALGIALCEFAFMLVLPEAEDSTWRRKLIAFGLIVSSYYFHKIVIVSLIPFLFLIHRKRFEIIGLFSRKLDDEQREGGSAKRIIIRVLLVAIIVFITYRYLVGILERYLSAYYRGYLYGAWSDENYGASLVSTLITLVYAVAGILTLRNTEFDSVKRFSVIMVSTTLLFSILSMRMEIWSRIASMFSMYTYICLAPEIVENIVNEKNRRIVHFGMIGFGLLYMLVVLVFRPEWSSVVPYLLRIGK